MCDETNLKKMEEYRRQAQKMESIGTLAGGVAHDFNNILTVIRGATALLEIEAADNKEQMKIVSQISISANRAAKLTQSLLTFSRRETINMQPEDLVDIVKNMEHLLEQIIGDDILLTTYLPDEALMVSVDRGKIEQVLMNLAINSRDAMPQGGILNISVTQVGRDDSLLEPEGYLEREYARITVSDTGVGIDEATKKRIFDPYFTTKTIMSGTGLGLSVVYGIIHHHCGEIEVDSEPSGGTAFKIDLPIYNKRAA